MRYFKLTIAYDGTDFHGWQIQAEKPTIQGEIVNVLRRLTQEHVYLHGAGRTDAGVHALGQVGSFRTQSPLSAQEFQRALNALLPQTIRIVGSEEVGPDFDARWSARGKIYRYRIYRGKVVPPMFWRYVLHYPFPLDEEAMRDAAARFAGTHDFASFAASTGSEEDDKERSTEREIFSTEPPSRRSSAISSAARSVDQFICRVLVKARQLSATRARTKHFSCSPTAAIFRRERPARRLRPFRPMP